MEWYNVSFYVDETDIYTFPQKAESRLQAIQDCINSVQGIDAILELTHKIVCMYDDLANMD